MGYEDSEDGQPLRQRRFVLEFPPCFVMGGDCDDDDDDVASVWSSHLPLAAASIPTFLRALQRIHRLKDVAASLHSASGYQQALAPSYNATAHLRVDV